MDIKMSYDMKIDLSPQEELALATTGDIIKRIETLINDTEVGSFSTFFSEYYENDMVEFLIDLQSNKARLRGFIREYSLLL